MAVVVHVVHRHDHTGLSTGARVPGLPSRCRRQPRDVAADWDEIGDLMSVQDGIITRSQLAERGATYADLQRLVRRKELVRLAPGVYVNHTGEPTWCQRAWVAVLALWPAALSHASVWRETRVIHVAVDADRRPSPRPGVKIHRMRHFEERVAWNRSPPRIAIEHAALDAAGDAKDEHSAVSVLAEVVQQRHTSATRLRSCSDTRPRSPRGSWLRDVVDDIASGAWSVLEREYLRRVERPHGLPCGRRQLTQRPDGRRADRDVSYEELGLEVELDGRLFHDNAEARDRDLDRDLDAQAFEGGTTIRLGWGQVLRRPCATARKVAMVMTRLGWTGSLTPCPRCTEMP